MIFEEVYILSGKDYAARRVAADNVVHIPSKNEQFVQNETAKWLK